MSRRTATSRSASRRRPRSSGLAEGAVGAAALEVAALRDPERRRLFRRRHQLVAHVDVVDGPAVRDHVPVEAPLLAQDVQEQALAGRGRLAVDAVVGAHDGRHLPFLHEGAERGEVRLVEIALAGAGVEVVAVRLRAAVDREVLGGGDDLEVPRVVSLQALHEGDTQPAREIRVLPVRLLPPPPARVAEDVDVGRPEGEALVAAALPLAHELVVLGPGLVRDDAGHLVHERLVEGGGEADRLREDGGDAGPGHPVEALVPPLVGGHAQARDRRRLVRELGDLLLDAHPRHEVAGPGLEVEVGIQVGRRRLGLAPDRDPEAARRSSPAVKPAEITRCLVMSSSRSQGPRRRSPRRCARLYRKLPGLGHPEGRRRRPASTLSESTVLPR